MLRVDLADYAIAIAYCTAYQGDMKLLGDLDKINVFQSVDQGWIQGVFRVLRPSSEI